MLNPETTRTVAREVASQVVGRAIKTDGQKLVSSGLIDSLSVLRLISLLEKELQVSIPPETLQPEDFDDVNLIVETVERVAMPRS
jgi:acyl carrier protein